MKKNLANHLNDNLQLFYNEAGNLLKYGGKEINREREREMGRKE